MRYAKLTEYQIKEFSTMINYRYHSALSNNNILDAAYLQSCLIFHKLLISRRSIILDDVRWYEIHKLYKRYRSTRIILNAWKYVITQYRTEASKLYDCQN